MSHDFKRNMSEFEIPSPFGHVSPSCVLAIVWSSELIALNIISDVLNSIYNTKQIFFSAKL